MEKKLLITGFDPFGGGSINPSWEAVKLLPDFPKAVDQRIIDDHDVLACLQAAKESDLYSGRFAHVSEIALSGDGGITVTMDTPCENLPILLDIPIIKASQTDAATPLGTGPYILESTGTGMQLRRQAAWWCNATLPVGAQTIPLYHGTTQSELWDLYKFSGLSMVCTALMVESTLVPLLSLM